DLASVGLSREIGARVHGLAVEEHHAGPALGVVAALLRPGEAHGVAHRVEEARARVDLDRVRDIVDREGGGGLPGPTPCKAGLAGTGTASPRARATAASMARRAMTAAIARR